MIKGKVKDKATAESEFKSLMDELQANVIEVDGPHLRQLKNQLLTLNDVISVQPVSFVTISTV